jgi:superfamily II DNA or RNA helicase
MPKLKLIQMVQIQIHNINSQIIGLLPDKVKAKLTMVLSYAVPGAFYAMQRARFWDGRRKFFTPVTQVFPTGLIHYVEEVLDQFGIEHELVDMRNPSYSGGELRLCGFKLRDYQQIAVDMAITKQRGIIKMATGSGKTNTIMGVIARLNVPTLVLIHKTDIFYQLVHRFEEGLKIPIGKIGDGEFDIQRVTVGMIQTVAKVYDKDRMKKVTDKEKLKQAEAIKALVENCQCIITDEAHHVAADTFWAVQKAAVNAYYRYGFSASPWRIDNADLLIEAAHAKKMIDISASSLIDRGVLVRPKIYLLESRHEKKTRTQKYSEIYDDEVVNNLDRNMLVVDTAIKAASLGKTVLIAVTKIAHGEILEELLQQRDPTALFVCGDSDSQLRQDVLTELDQHKRKIVICTTIFGEGIDCPGLDVLINAKAADSSIDAFQLLGRVIRAAPGKKIAHVIDIFDRNCKYLTAHASSREEIYATEERYKIIKVSNIDQINFNGDFND